jgi:hypothetical protein
MEMSNFAQQPGKWRRHTAPSESGDAGTEGLPLDRFQSQLPIPINPDEQPGPDGIRWGLVQRIQAEIAAGYYDDDEKFAMATELMLQRIGG